MDVKNILKYFAHGIIFSIIFIILGIAWIFALAILVVAGFIIGLIIGLALLILIIGFINAIVTSFLWFPVKTSFWSLLAHGFALFIILIPIDLIVAFIPNYVFPEISILIITRIVIAFLYGYIGKGVAGFWAEETSEEVPESVEAEWKDRYRGDSALFEEQITLSRC